MFSEAKKIMVFKESKDGVTFREIYGLWTSLLKKRTSNGNITNVYTCSSKDLILEYLYVKFLAFTTPP